VGTKRKKRAGAGWRRRFLAALARTANAKLAAEMAGVDHSTAYQLRQRDAGFARDWVRARNWGRARVEAEGRPVHPCGRPPDARKDKAAVAADAGGGGGATPLVVRKSKREGAQVVRAGEGRWTEEAEEVFLAHLAATANVRAAARAAGFSTTAVYKRRMLEAGFAERWDMAKVQGAARIDLLLIESVDRALDPEVAEAAEALPKPTIAEAIQIARLFHADERRGRGEGGGARGAAPAPPPSIEAVRDEVLRRLAAIRRHRAERPPSEGEAQR
jgi:hypothetical protein